MSAVLKIVLQEVFVLRDGESDIVRNPHYEGGGTIIVDPIDSDDDIIIGNPLEPPMKRP